MSDQLKEPRCDAKLKNLPEDRQDQIFQYRKQHGLEKTVAWLAEDGVKVSTVTLSQFCSWYRLKQNNALRESRVLQFMEMLKAEKPQLSQEELFQYGQMHFSTLALEDENAEQWVNVQQLTASTNLEAEKLKLKKQAEQRMQDKLKLEQKKFQRQSVELFLEWFEDNRARQIASSSEPKADRTEKLGQLIFKEDW